MHAATPTIQDRPRQRHSLTAIVGCLCLLVANGNALGSFLMEYNVISAPRPSSYSKAAPARTERKTSAPTGQELSQPAHRQNITPAVAPVKEASPLVRHEVRHVAKPEETPASADVLIGSNDPAKSKTSVRFGYGRMVADNSDIVARRSDPRLEEPGCFYVKTTVHF